MICKICFVNFKVKNKSCYNRSNIYKYIKLVMKHVCTDLKCVKFR